MNFFDVYSLLGTEDLAVNEIHKASNSNSLCVFSYYMLLRYITYRSVPRLSVQLGEF